MDFLRGHDKEFTEDISGSLRDRDAWKPGQLKQLGLKGQLAVLAHDVVNGVLAAATDSGQVYVFGSPPATHCLHLQGTAADAGIKHLGFAASATRLVACDTRNKLHVWSLSSTGPPSLEGSLHVGDVVNCMVTSLYHSHALLGLKSGRTLTFDVDRLQLSPYAIPNAWQKHESVLRRSGIPSPTSPSFDIAPPPMVIDLAIHPRDLNLLLIGYERGVVLWNIMEERPVSHYSLSLLPGAPGAMLEPDKSPLLMEERCPPPTCVAWHPDGRLFAIGHMDGCISFWSVEEEDKPLDVRTVDRAGVHKVDFEAFAAAAGLSPSDSTPTLTHEPIYKLEWTPKLPGPNFVTPSKGSYLTVLGGLQPTAPPGIPCLFFPVFVPPANAAVSAEGLDSNPALRDALIESVTPTAYAEILSNPQLLIEDMIVVPEYNQMLITKSSRDGRRKLWVEPHPPSAFVDTVQSLTTIPELDGVLPPPPQHVLDARPTGALGPSRLPVELMMSDIIDAQLYVVPKSELGSLVRRTVDRVFLREGGADQQDVHNERLSWLRIGQAVPHTEGHSKMAKFEPSRIIVATHGDGIVRFYDASSQLLLAPTPLRFEHPQPLPNLNIDPHWTISHPLLQKTLAASPACRRADGAPAYIHSRIHSVHFAPNSLDCALVLARGWVLLYQFTPGGTPVPFEVNESTDGLIDLRPMSFVDEEGFRPVCLVAENMRGEVTCAALSDVGFMAIAYEDCSIVILDLRGPVVVGRYEPHIEQGKRSAQDGPVRSFRWAQCALSEDDSFAVHLICIAESGLARVFTLSPPNNRNPNWSVRGQPKSAKHSSLAQPIFNTVIDLGSGSACEPTVAGLEKVVARVGSRGYGPSLWIAASQTRLRAYAGVLGREIAHVDRKPGNEVIGIDLVEKHGEAVMVTFERGGEITIYALPRLDRVNSFSLGHSIARIDTDSQGDFIVKSDQGSLSIQTLADFSRAQLPLVDFSTPAPVVRDRPEPVDAGGIVSWLWSTKSKTGAEIDACLAGPNRPPPKARKAKYVPAERPPSGPITSSRLAATGSSTARASAATGPSDVYSRLAAAVSERSNMLSGLEDKFAHLETASKDLASQAKRVAAQQGAKRWLGF